MNNDTLAELELEEARKAYEQAREVARIAGPDKPKAILACEKARIRFDNAVIAKGVRQEERLKRRSG